MIFFNRKLKVKEGTKEYTSCRLVRLYTSSHLVISVPQHNEEKLIHMGGGQNKANRKGGGRGRGICLWFLQQEESFLPLSTTSFPEYSDEGLSLC